jgi:hypothetical protein
MITLKIKNLPRLNELEYVQYKYNEAVKTMLDFPSETNIGAFILANKKLFEVKDAYRIAERLLNERDLQMVENSQELHLL